MPDPTDIARDVSHLLSDTISADRFRDWRMTDVAPVLGDYVFGEIFWKKSIGRPNFDKLSDGFTIDAWHDEMVLVGTPGGAAHWITLPAPHQASWWDAPPDEDFWRISFMVPGLARGKAVDGIHHQHSHIVPKLVKKVSWTIPGGEYGIGAAGLKAIEPSGATFTGESGPLHLSFEVVLKSLFVFRDGIGRADW